MISCPVCHVENPDDSRFCGSCGVTLRQGITKEPLIGKRLAGRYLIRRVVAEGGMGIVYEAEQVMGETTRSVAVKTLLPDLSQDSTVVSRFQRECGIVAQLEHPNTVRVFDYGRESEGTLFIVMEFVRGQSLGDVIALGPLPNKRTVHILQQMGSALHEAHELGLIHRDLKPENVVLTTRAGQVDFVKLLDFGIAVRASAGAEHQTKLTQQGMVLGTPPYMSPEQFAGGTVDRRSDIYSLAVIAYEMISGRLPFEADTPWQWAHQHISESPRALDPSVPAPIRRAILAGLSKAPDARPSTTLEFCRQLAQSPDFDQKVPSVVDTEPDAEAPEAPLSTANGFVSYQRPEPQAETSLPGGTSTEQNPLLAPVGTQLGPRAPGLSAVHQSVHLPVAAIAAIPRAARRRRPVLGTVLVLLLLSIGAAAAFVLLRPRPVATTRADMGANAVNEPTVTEITALDPTPRVPSVQTTTPKPTKTTPHVAPAKTSTPTTVVVTPSTAAPTPAASSPTVLLPAGLPSQFPTLSLPVPGNPEPAATAAPEPRPTVSPQPAVSPAACDQAVATAQTDLSAAVDQYQRCVQAVGTTAARSTRTSIASTAEQRVKVLARDGRCAEARAVVAAASRIGVQRPAQIQLERSPCR